MAEGGVTGKGFVKGDPRINRKGRPKSFDAFHKLAQSIGNEAAMRKNKTSGEIEPVEYDGHLMTVAEEILRSWAHSKSEKLQIAFVQYAYGKVPDKVDVTGAGNITLTPKLEKMDDDQLRKALEQLSVIGMALAGSKGVSAAAPDDDPDDAAKPENEDADA